LWRTPWFLPAFGAASVATVVFLVRVLKNPEVLPGQHPHSIEERAVATPEAVPPPEPLPSAQPASANAPAVQAKPDQKLADAKQLPSADAASRHRAKWMSSRVEESAPIIKKKSFLNDSLDGLSIGEGRAGRGAPSRFAEPPPPRQAPAKSSKALDDLIGSFEKGAGTKPSRERAAELDDLSASPTRDEEFRTERKAPTGLASAKKTAVPESSAGVAKPVSRLHSESAGLPAAAASPAYAPAPVAMPAGPRPTPATASAPAPVSPPPASKHENMKQAEEAKEAAVVEDSDVADYDVAAKDKAAKGGGKSVPSLEEALRKAERLYAGQDWNAAAEAYRDLLRRFPGHKDAPKWRDRMNESSAAYLRALEAKRKKTPSDDPLSGSKM